MCSPSKSCNYHRKKGPKKSSKRIRRNSNPSTAILNIDAFEPELEYTVQPLQQPLATPPQHHVPQEDSRVYDPAYAHFYYTQNVIDPRLPCPRITREQLQFCTFAPAPGFYPPMQNVPYMPEMPENGAPVELPYMDRLDSPYAPAIVASTPILVHTNWGMGESVSEVVPGAGLPSPEMGHYNTGGQSPSGILAFNVAQGVINSPNVSPHSTWPPRQVAMPMLGHPPQGLRLCRPGPKPLVIPLRQYNEPQPTPPPPAPCHVAPSTSPGGEKKALRQEAGRLHSQSSKPSCKSLRSMPRGVSNPSHRRNHSADEVLLSSSCAKEVPQTPLEEFHALLVSIKRDRARLKRARKSEKVSPASSPGSDKASPKGESIIDEFLALATSKWQLQSLKGHLAAFATDQLGSRFLQTALGTAPDSAVATAADELAPHSRQLMVDPFGNYVMQRLVERSPPERRRVVVQEVLDAQQVLSLSGHEFGCRVMQKILEVAPRDQRELIVGVLEARGAGALVGDPHANHVIQRLLETTPSQRVAWVAEHFVGRATESCYDKYACRVLLRVIEYGPKELAAQLVQEVVPHAKTLAHDQFGNYAVQQVLQHGTSEARQALIAVFAGHWTEMSMQKFASNVVEKCLSVGSAPERQAIIAEVLDGPTICLDNRLGEGEEAQALRGVAVSPLIAIMVHPYGNYVVQRMIEFGTSSQAERIVARIKELATGLERGKFGKHMLASIEDLVALPIPQLAFDAATAASA